MKKNMMIMMLMVMIIRMGGQFVLGLILGFYTPYICSILL